MKSYYESKVSWMAEMDHLRCNPCFYNKPRFDFVILLTLNEIIFGRLVFIFTYTIDDTPYPFALIQTFDAATGVSRRIDRDLGFIRIRAQLRDHAEFFPARSIIRGAFVVPTNEKADEYFVVDVVDTDMFIRIQEYKASR